MSDFQQGSDWWQASDGKWYPPAEATQAIPTQPAQTYTETTTYTSPPERRSGLRPWHLLAAGVISWFIGVMMGIGIGLANDGEEDRVASASTSSTVAATSTTAQATTTTARPTTTTTPPTTVPPTTAPPQPRELLRTSGTGDKETPAFNVRSGWTVRWDMGGQAKSSGMRIIVMDEATGEEIANYVTESNDESIVRKTCRCYLDIRSYGETYTVTVTGIPA